MTDIVKIKANMVKHLLTKEEQEIKLRVSQQKEYINNLLKSNIPIPRLTEVLISAEGILEYWENKLEIYQVW